MTEMNGVLILSELALVCNELMCTELILLKAQPEDYKKILEEKLKNHNNYIDKLTNLTNLMNVNMDAYTQIENIFSKEGDD